MESTTSTSDLLFPAEEEAMEKVNDGLVRVEETLDSSGVIVCRKRRKDDDVDRDRDEKMKKRRVDWTPELHQKFERVVNHLGLDKCGPKKILEMMGVPWLRREQVASHLQKYRLQKQKEQKEAKAENTCFETNAINLHQNYFVAGNMNMQMQMPIPIQRGSENTNTNANTNTLVDHNRPIFVAPLNPSRPIVQQSNIPFNTFSLPPFPTREEDIRLRNIDSFGWANQQPGVARDLNIEDELFRGPNRHQIVDEMPFIRRSPNRYQIVDEMPFIRRICGDDDYGSKSGK